MTDRVETSDNSNQAILDLTGQVVSAYVRNNAVPVAEVANLISTVFEAFARADGGTPAPGPRMEPLTPSQIKKSITPDHLISFIDGHPYKTLKRHLSRYGLTIEQYREKYGLPRDYPSVSENYSRARSTLAKSLGLGQQRRKRP